MDDSYTITLTGDLTIKRASEIQQTLTNALHEHKSIQVVVDNPDSMDLTCVQLLHFAKQSAMAVPKKFVITSTLSSEIRDLLMKSGIEEP